MSIGGQATEEPNGIDQLVARGSEVWVGLVHRRRSQRLAENRVDSRRFNRNLRIYWGQALDHYEMLWLWHHELGSSAQKRWAGKRPPGGAPTFNALIGIHGRACLAAGAVHTLLCTGYATSAEVHWRTLHELAVVAVLLAEEGADEVALAYQEHELVARLKAARRYEKHCDELGLEPLPDGLIASMEERERSLVEKYGNAFRSDWGWALQLFPDRTAGYRPSFEDLEKRAGVAHLSPYYAQGSSHVHGGPRGITLTMVEARGETVRLAGPSNTGLVEPATGSLEELHRVTVALLGRPSMVSFDVSLLPQLEAAETLALETARLFSEGHARLERAEHRYVAAEGAGEWAVRRLLWMQARRRWTDAARQLAREAEVVCTDVVKR